jgi:hypothetical protein
MVQQPLQLRRSSQLHQLILQVLLLPTLLETVARGQSGRARKTQTGLRRLCLL